MTKQKISYYDLLTLMKNGNIPKEICLYICNEKTKYYYSQADGSYLLKNRKKQGYKFSFYLNETITDIQSLEPIIEIVKK